MGDQHNPEQGRTFKWKARLLEQVLPMGLPVVTLAATAMAGVNHGYAKLYWFTIAGSAVLGSALIAVNKDKEKKTLRKQAVQAKTNLAMALSGAGQPLMAALTAVSAARTAPEARAAVSVLVNRTVAVAKEACGRQTEVECRTRAVFYRFVGDDLQVEYCEGRQGEKPRDAFFQNGTAHDIEAIRTARGRNALVVDDLENNPPAHFFDPKGRKYKAFIAAPVRTDAKSFGMLIIDSDKAFTLSDVDTGYLVLLASIIAAGFAHLHSAEQADEDRARLESETARLESETARLESETARLESELKSYKRKSSNGTVVEPQIPPRQPIAKGEDPDGQLVSES
ncbi:GAF domain-containing protein [Micromonospora chalcea]|uniref:GAF domain-containing protein n=1 Tax=Micromonospora chalcea TaxID=1874 RepID=UPI0033C2BB9B